MGLFKRGDTAKRKGDVTNVTGSTFTNTAVGTQSSVTVTGATETTGAQNDLAAVRALFQDLRGVIQGQVGEHEAEALRRVDALERALAADQPDVEPDTDAIA